MTKSKETINEAWKLFREGMKITEIAKKLNVSRGWLNEQGITKEEAKKIQQGIIHREWLDKTPVEETAGKLHIKERTVTAKYREFECEEEKLIIKKHKQPLDIPSIKGKPLPRLHRIEAKGTRRGKTETIEAYKKRKEKTERAFDEPTPSRDKDEATEDYIKRVTKGYRKQRGGLVLVPETKAETRVSAQYKHDLWNFTTKRGKPNYRLTTERGLFGSNTLNIPFLDYQPAKRIHLVSKAIYEWKETKPNSGVFYPESGFVKLNEPEPCLIEAVPGVNEGLRHDIDTINLSVGLPTNKEDYDFTKDDACIISAKTAKRLSFTAFQSLLFTVDESVVFLQRKHIKKGELLGKDIHGNDFISLYEGALSITGETPVKNNRKVIQASLWINRAAEIGDKITGLTGLKVVIGEVRQDIPVDIIISKNQIWNTEKNEDGTDKKPDGQRGAMVKELLATGKIMVGLRKETLWETKATRNKGARLSPTFYQTLNLYDKKTTLNIIKDNSRFYETLLALHLKWDKDKERFTLLNENEIDTSVKEWVEYPHYLYTKTAFMEHFEGTEEGKGFQIAGIDFQKRRTFSAHENILKIPYSQVPPGRYVVFDYCYSPSFIPERLLTSQGIKNSLLHTPFKKGLDNTLENRVSRGEAEFPLIAKGKGKRKAGITENNVKRLIRNQLFCEIRNGYWLVAVPSVNTPENIIIMNNEAHFGVEKDGEYYAMVIREPVVDKKNVAAVRIIHDPSLPLGVVRISPVVMSGMNGDFDGDALSIIPYFSKEFIPEITRKTQDKQKAPRWIKYEEPRKYPALKTFLSEIEPKLRKRTDAEMIAEAVKNEQTLADADKDSEFLGGKRNQAAYLSPESEQERILKLSETLENIRKIERLNPGKRKETIEELDKIIKRAKGFTPENKDLHKLLDYRNKFSYRFLLGFKPPLFWKGLFIAPQDPTEELREEAAPKTETLREKRRKRIRRLTKHAK